MQMPSSSLEGQELDVVVWPTDRPGEFHVSEPNVAPSPASARRARLEQQLSDAVVQSLRDDPLRSDPIRVHDVSRSRFHSLALSGSHRVYP